MKHASHTSQTEQQELRPLLALKIVVAREEESPPPAGKKPIAPEGDQLHETSGALLIRELRHRSEGSDGIYVLVKRREILPLDRVDDDAAEANGVPSGDGPILHQRP